MTLPVEGNRGPTGRQRAPRPVAGILLSLITVMAWGAVPIFMKPVASAADVMTINWFRMFCCGLCLATLLIWRGQAGDVLRLLRRARWLNLALIGGLVANLTLYVAGLRLVSEVVCQTTIQLAPVLFAVSSLLMFGERFNKWQLSGCGVLAAGYWLFFRYRLLTIADPGNLVAGVAVISLSAVCWTVYALAQKRMQSEFRPLVILALVFLGGAVALLPATSFGALVALDRPLLAMLAGATLSTLIGYVTFVKALELWLASRVSAVLTVTPIVTMLMVAIASTLFPTWFSPSLLPIPSVIGAFLVVAGSAMTALAKETAVSR